MLYDMLIYDCENVIYSNDPGNSAIRINDCSQQEMETLVRLFGWHDVNVCLFPHPEGNNGNVH